MKEKFYAIVVGLGIFACMFVGCTHETPQAESSIESKIVTDEKSDDSNMQLLQEQNLSFDDNNTFDCYAYQEEDGRVIAMVQCKFDGKNKELEVVRTTGIISNMRKRFVELSLYVSSGTEYGFYLYENGEMNPYSIIPDSYQGVMNDIDMNDYTEEIERISKIDFLPGI